MYQRGNNGYNRKKRWQDRRNLVKRSRPLENNELLFILPLLTVTVTCIASLARLRHCVTSMRPRKVVMINDYLSISDDQQPKDIALGDNYELVSQVARGQLENWLQKKPNANFVHIHKPEHFYFPPKVIPYDSCTQHGWKFLQWK